MPLDPLPTAALEFAFEVERFFSALLKTSGMSSQAEPSLGGKLLYAGELDTHGRALMVAGNIAGAASLGATADLSAQRQAVRDGVADFLVTSLDEALRILKNEIRKHETVAVCGAAAPQTIEEEMLERGVRADLSFLDPSIAALAPQAKDLELERVVWSVAASPAQWLPRLDALAIECFGSFSNPEAKATERWLRLGPRYLGRLAHGFRILRGRREAAQEFVARVRSSIVQGEIGVEVRINLNDDQETMLLEPRKLKHS